MKVRFWGVRGSIPSPGPATARYGGNTTCIEVRSARWDGTSPSPLSAACRGVISGFGTRAIATAVSLVSG